MTATTVSRRPSTVMPIGGVGRTGKGCHHPLVLLGVLDRKAAEAHAALGQLYRFLLLGCCEWGDGVRREGRGREEKGGAGAGMAGRIGSLLSA